MDNNKHSLNWTIEREPLSNVIIIRAKCACGYTMGLYKCVENSSKCFISDDAMILNMLQHGFEFALLWQIHLMERTIEETRGRRE